MSTRFLPHRARGSLMHHGAALLSAAILVAACGGDDDPAAPQVGACDDVVDLFPVPVSDGTSGFPFVDDSFIRVNFHPGFSFSFYGTTYSSVYLNTNGGMTFGSGEGDYDLAADQIDQPAIAVFWGDMDAFEYAGVNRAGQLTYQTCEDRFILEYDMFQDNDDGTWNNTATVVLDSDGRIEIDYGSVLSEDIVAGVWNGTHTADQYLAVQSEYTNYFATGTGIVLFDYWGAGPDHTGGLSNRTVVYNPLATAAYTASVSEPDADRDAASGGAKGPKG